MASPKLLWGCVLSCAACGGAGDAPDAQTSGDGGVGVDAADVDAANLNPCGTGGELSSRVPWGAPVLYEIPTDTVTAKGVSFTENGLTLFFHESAFKAGTGLRMATRQTTGNPWTLAAALELQSEDAESEAFVSADGLEVWFSSDRSGALDDILRSTRSATTEVWSAPLVQNSLRSSRADQGFTTTPARTLGAFSSDRDDGDLIDFDLYLVTRAVPDGAWDTPMRLDALDVGDETAPALSSDGLELYYGATRANGLCVAIRDSVDEPFLLSTVVSEVNVVGSVASPWISADGHILFVSAYDLAANRWRVYSASR